MRHVTITFPSVHSDKIAVIKALRNLTSCGLKEAKDASEVAGQPTVFQIRLPVGVVYPDAHIKDQIRILRNNNCKVDSAVEEILRTLRDVAADALSIDEDELANEILQLVLAEKLRRKPNEG